MILIEVNVMLGFYKKIRSFYLNLTTFFSEKCKRLNGCSQFKKKIRKGVKLVLICILKGKTKIKKGVKLVFK